MRKTIFIVSFLLYTFSGAYLSADDLARHLLISGLEEAQAPIYHQATDSLVFTYANEQQRHQPRYVGVAFEHEHFSQIHEMRYYDTRDDEGNLESRVYFLFLPIDEDIENMESIQYRYIIDGIWMEDPKNPKYSRKLSGRKLSTTDLPDERQIELRSPEILEDNEFSRTRIVRFLYKGEPEQSIYLAGSFNNWDPFMYRLEEHPLDPGNYHIELRLLPGEYHYSYYYKGRAIQDPLNIQSSYDIDGSVYSYFSIDS